MLNGVVYMKDSGATRSRCTDGRDATGVNTVNGTIDHRIRCATNPANPSPLIMPIATP